MRICGNCKNIPTTGHLHTVNLQQQICFQCLPEIVPCFTCRQAILQRNVQAQATVATESMGTEIGAPIATPPPPEVVHNAGFITESNNAGPTNVPHEHSYAHVASSDRRALFKKRPMKASMIRRASRPSTSITTNKINSRVRLSSRSLRSRETVEPSSLPKKHNLFTGGLGDRTFAECDKCKKRLANPAVLKKHMELVHAKRRKVCRCPYCWRKLKDKAITAMHIACVHGQGRNENAGKRGCFCIICQERFTRRRALWKHIMRIHMEAIEWKEEDIELQVYEKKDDKEVAFQP